MGSALTTPSIDPERLREAACAAADIYNSPSSFQYLRTIEQFKLSGELRGGYRQTGRGRAIVAIRGTSPVGNWLFTNLQAHFTEFRVVDDQLRAVAPKALQGGQMRVPIEGALHQGYFRAFSLMWYGTEPLLGDLQRTRVLGLTRLVRYGIVFAGIPLLLCLLLSSVTLGLVLGLALAFAVTIAESGVWEDLFHREPAISGDRPMSALHKLNDFEEVIFAGHSLGGRSQRSLSRCIARGAEAIRLGGTTPC